MFQFEGVENASRALTLLGAELVVVIASCLLLGLLARLVLSRADAIPALGKHPERLAGIRRRIRFGLIFLGLGLSLGVVGLNGYLVYLRTDPYVQTMAWITGIPSDFWLKLGLRVAAVAGLVIVARVVIGLLHRLFASFMAKAKAFEGIRANDESIEEFFGSLTSILSNSIRFLIVI